MQVVAGGRPRAADQPDALPDADRSAFPYKDPAHVRVQGRVSILMADTDEPSVAPAVTGLRHFPVSCGVYRLAIRGGQVHSLMEHPPSLKGMRPAPEPGGDPVAGTPAVKGKQDRVIRQDGDRLPQPSSLPPPVSPLPGHVRLTFLHCLPAFPSRHPGKRKATKGDNT